MATKLKGTCVVCGKKLTVNKKGFLREHSNSTDGENSHGYCLGSYDVPPREFAVEGFHQVREDAINSANRIQRTLDSDPDYRPQTLKAMAAEVEGFYVTAD